MSAMRIHVPGQEVEFVDLGPTPHVPLLGHATLHGHVVRGESAAAANRRYQREHKARVKTPARIAADRRYEQRHREERNAARRAMRAGVTDRDVDEPVTARRPRDIASYSRGTHFPAPKKDSEGRWRCADCGRRLNRYTDDYGVVRLRHYWRDR